jgi:hypothetical protein
METVQANPSPLANLARLSCANGGPQNLGLDIRTSRAVSAAIAAGNTRANAADAQAHADFDACDKFACWNRR